MVQVSFADSYEFDALAYKQPHPSTLRFLENQFTNMSQTLSDAGRQFFSNAQSLFDSFTNSTAVRLAQAALRKAGSLFQRDEVRSIWDLGEIQNAPLTMQRFIMANPTVREMYHQQRCDGYSGTYVDQYPDDVGRDHYDYRRVTDGVLIDTPDDEEYEWKCTVYFDELVEGDRPLLLEQQVDIMTMWDRVEDFMKVGKDPTSVFGGEL